MNGKKQGFTVYVYLKRAAMVGSFLFVSYTRTGIIIINRTSHFLKATSFVLSWDVTTVSDTSNNSKN